MSKIPFEDFITKVGLEGAYMAMSSILHIRGSLRGRLPLTQLTDPEGVAWYCVEPPDGFVKLIGEVGAQATSAAYEDRRRLNEREGKLGQKEAHIKALSKSISDQGAKPESSLIEKRDEFLEWVTLERESITEDRKRVESLLDNRRLFTFLIDVETLETQMVKE